MKLREIIGTKEYKRSLEKLQRELTQPQRTPAETEEFLYGETYFTRFELREILSKFSAYGDMLSSQELLQVIIQSADADQANNFQAYEKLHQLVQQLLVATTFTHDSCNTVNFIRCLSTLSRGSRDERLQLVFRLCDASKDGIVERSEFLQIGNLIQDFVTSFPLSFKLFSNPRPQVPPSSTSRANEVMENEDVVQAFASDEPIPIDDDNNNNNNNNNTRHDEQFINWQFHNFASPEDASQLIFGGPGDKHHAEKLNMKHFIERAKVDPDAHRCFGLFDFFYQVFVLPVDKLSRNHGPTDSQGNFTGINHNGQLHMLTKYSHQYVDHYVHIRDKCAVFTSTKDGQIKDVIPLNNAYVTIRQPHPKNIVRNSGHKIHTVAHNHVPRKTSINTNSGSYCPHLALDHGAVALQIRLNQRAYKRVILVAPNMQEAQLWMEALRSNAKGGYAFGTMSPWRENVNPQWFVNGKDYFSAIADGIAAAKNEIFISDWWLVPSIYLKRSTPLDDNYRLDNMLKAAAQRGVIVYVLIWDESNLLNLGSRVAQSILRKLHDHIYVIRHPPQVPVVFSHHQKITVIDQELAFLGGIDLCTGRYDDHNFCVLDPERCTHPDDDYVNACLHTSSRYHIHSRIEILDREHYPRLPWHDIGISVDGDAARDVSLNFIQRWNFSRKQWAPLKGTYQKYNHYPLITPKPAINNNTQNDNNTQNNSSSGALVLRSIGPWSAGQEFEDSIYRVYIMLIMSACHYIYIQNQYFISSTYATQPRNKIALAIVKRIGIAIRANETFKVFVLLPVHTEGYLYEPANIKLVEWTYKTIKAICDALHNEFPGLDISQYITFNALRSWAVRNDHLFTEQVYIHAKLLIVDDKAAVIGSCNINDRSMLGNRDSEIAVVTGDRVPSPSRMNGISFGASKFALSLRMKLWQCHLGIQPGTWEEAVIQDPVCADSWNIWHQTALKNTSIFSRVFGTHIPEECTSLAQLKRPNLVTATPSNILELREVKGFLIKYPFFMLNQEFSGNDNVPSNLFGKIYL